MNSHINPDAAPVWGDTINTNNRGWPASAQRLRKHPARASMWSVNGVGYIMPSGYIKVCVRAADGKVCVDYEHRVAYRATHGEIPPGFDIDHIDGNRSNNEPANLRAISRAEHMRKHHLDRRPSHIVIDGVEHKRCRACNEVLPLSMFFKTSKAKGTVNTYEHQCKECKGDARRARKARMSCATVKPHHRGRMAA